MSSLTVPIYFDSYYFNHFAAFTSQGSIIIRSEIDAIVNVSIFSCHRVDRFCRIPAVALVPAAALWLAHALVRHLRSI